MFERYTEVLLAQEEARGLNHAHLGTEHILLGLLREEQGIAARVLESLEITADRTRVAIARRVPESSEKSGLGNLPFTPNAQKVLDYSLREALSLGHNYIGTEHILLGLVRENEGVAARILLDFDADPEKIRNEVIRMLARSAKAKAPGEPGGKAAPVTTLGDEAALRANARGTILKLISTYAERGNADATAILDLSLQRAEVGARTRGKHPRKEGGPYGYSCSDGRYRRHEGHVEPGR